MDPIFSRLTQRGSLFELAETRVDAGAPKIFLKAPRTLRDLFRKADAFREHTMLITSEARFSYAEAVDRSDELSATLLEPLGLRARDRAAIVASNGIDWVVAFLAIASRGACAVLIDARRRADQVARMCSQAECRLVIADESMALELCRYDAAWRRVAIERPAESWTRAQKVVVLEHQVRFGRPSRSRSEQDVGPDDDAVVAYTSGTTGDPKGAILTHRNLVTGCMNMMLGSAANSLRSRMRIARPRFEPHTGPPRTLLLAPLSHIGGFAQIILSFFVASTLVLLEDWDAERARAMISCERIRSITGGSPDMIRELLRNAHSDDDFSSLAFIGINGMSTSDSLRREILLALPHVHLGSGYGATETCGSICSAEPSADLEDSSGTLRRVGSPLPTVEIRIAGRDGDSVAPGEPGEIWVRGAMVMREYCGAPGETAAALHDGWFRTKDRGALDAQGILFVDDRRSLAPDSERSRWLSLEAEVGRLSGVDEAVVCEAREFAMAVVIDSRRRGEAQALTVRIHELAERHGLPAQVVFVESMPRTSSGKIEHAALARMLEAKVDAVAAAR